MDLAVLVALVHRAYNPAAQGPLLRYTILYRNHVFLFVVLRVEIAARHAVVDVHHVEGVALAEDVRLVEDVLRATHAVHPRPAQRLCLYARLLVAHQWYRRVCQFVPQYHHLVYQFATLVRRSNHAYLVTHHR